MSVVVVTGTGTGVGKTIATAALTAAALATGRDVAVCKPVQTGSADGDDDLAEVGRLGGATELHGGWRYPEALAPIAAARRAGMELPTRNDLVDSVRAVVDSKSVTLVEGAGGLLVELGTDGVTLRDVAADLDAAVLVVVGPALGTLNDTALTLEALGTHSIPCAGLVIGAWPNHPGVAEVGNRHELSRLAPVRAVLPAGAAALDRDAFAAMSMAAYDAQWIATL